MQWNTFWIKHGQLKNGSWKKGTESGLRDGEISGLGCQITP